MLVKALILKTTKARRPLSVLKTTRLGVRTNTMANILILGGGFGGLVTAERLAAAIDRSKHQITLVAPNKNFTFYPALVHLALGECDETDITFDLRTKLEGLGVRFVQGEFISLDRHKQTARIAGDDFN